MPEIRNETKDKGFPSSGLIALLYGAGALAGLCCAFIPDLGAAQTTNCLLLSWLLALGAFAMSVICDTDSADVDDTDF
ncbi:MAG TPA: hypothetical protein PLP17_07100 [Oligoflexia bacterium]|nr:hypothetical protein [Oligoflexia bacterium]